MKCHLMQKSKEKHLTPNKGIKGEKNNIGNPKLGFLRGKKNPKLKT